MIQVGDLVVRVSDGVEGVVVAIGGERQPWWEKPIVSKHHADPLGTTVGATAMDLSLDGRLAAARREVYDSDLGADKRHVQGDLMIRYFSISFGTLAIACVGFWLASPPAPEPESEKPAEPCYEWAAKEVSSELSFATYFHACMEEREAQ